MPLPLKQETTALAIAFNYHSELDSKTLLLKPLHIQVIGYEEIKPDTSFLVASFIVLEGSMHTHHQERKVLYIHTQLWILKAKAMTSLASRGMNSMGAADHFLTGFKACFSKRNCCLVLLSGPTPWPPRLRGLQERIQYYHAKGTY